MQAKFDHGAFLKRLLNIDDYDATLERLSARVNATSSSAGAETVAAAGDVRGTIDAARPVTPLTEAQVYAAEAISYPEVRPVNGDTYHVTNFSPEVAAVDRSGSGQDNWGDFENIVLLQAASERFCVFCVPVLAEDDSAMLGKGGPRQRLRLQIPSRYWKVIVARGGEGLAAYAALLEQNLSGVQLRPVEDREFVAPDEFLRPLAPLKNIQCWTVVSFPAPLIEGDQYDMLRGTDAAERFASPRRRRQPQ